jgi:3-deoxy-D-manno-octulosonic acid kinase
MPFVERRDRDLFWRVDADLAPALEALGWPEAEAVHRALGSAAARGRTETSVLALPGRAERIHLRPVRHGGLLGPLWSGAVLGPGRPAEELRVTARLLEAGAPVPRPALVVAHRRAGPLWSAVLGTVHVEDARDGLAWLASDPGPTQLLRGARAVGAAVRRFHDAGGAHADLHAKNLLLREGEGDLEVRVIDLDRATAGAPPTPARRMRDLMRLVRGLHKRGVAGRVGIRGCAAAFAAYCDGDRALRRALLEHLPGERRRLARHRIAYR